ncbi:diguanylate cyclase (GGDEF)-like protein [Rhodococcus sp. PvR044]|uniref:putative bifunctional diguanylate cyclase/phosphodiesterase n=1 Tax=unclassified Rhodococcus (in: high G+C Gram-positive bacteria) TaxID=192944 RepID=UPI000BCCB1CC|nr:MULTISPECIES: EAL domain-containing protein [unclassified Rhodococcus (in: high G+C Gram-positive bacteria)]PTR42808.1 diguanylate cyclase/phosphodiesterase with GAF sensor [Rhodococcus sp. OK611]SNX91835.1 diguanylate cyclase/phosphodiesterase with GAF sensor [Rhodococcus sp. OK270]
MSVRTLEELVTAVASRLTATDAKTWVPSAEQVLHDLVDYFELDACFLRRNDHEIGATILVAEWPKRPFVPDPDPLAIVYFADADPDFARAEHLKEVGFVRPGQDSDDYQDRVAKSTGVPKVTLAAVPLLSGEVTTGTLGFIKFGDREWGIEEVNVLKAIAALLTQVQERVRAEEHIRHTADHDELTGLANRRVLVECLERRMERGMPGPVAVLFFDLDRLKSLNDFLGHTAGDAFIVEMSDRLRRYVGDRDIVARLGGDEFVIVFGGEVDLAAARVKATDINGIVNEGVRLGSVSVSRGASFGIAVAIPGQCSGADLLWQADHAVLAAKAQGGNAIATFNEDMRAEFEIRTIIELSLRTSINDDSLHLVYQPEVDMRNGTVLAVEALVRWDHPALGLLLPASFIEVAESTNLASELGIWVFRTACRQFARWRSEIPDLDLCLRVNVSPAQLVGLDFLEGTAQVLNEYEIAGESVCLEITENAMVSDLDRTRVTLRALSDLGIRVAIDDFGTGFSALAQLKQLKVDVLKIDREFIRDLGHSRGDLAIVKSIVSLAKSFGLDLVAEGVESASAARTLLELGCYRAQGFLFSHPLPADEAGDLLREGAIRPWTASATDPGTK